jgi:hypothetical protein
MTTRTRPCDDAVTDGRLRKAEQFWQAAEIARELADDEAGGAGVRVPASASAPPQ